MNDKVIAGYTLFLFMLVLVQRAIYRFIYSHDNSYDTYGHVFRIKHLRDFLKNERKPCEERLIVNRRLVQPADISCPNLTHTILSYFPEVCDIFFQRYFNAFLDAIYASILFVFLCYFTRQPALNCFLVILVYVFTPILFTTQSTGPRTVSLTPRMMGEFFCGIALISLCFFMEGQGQYWYFIAILLGSLSYMTNAFSAQVITFIPFIVGLISLNLYALCFPLLAFLLAILVGGRSFRVVMRFHLKYTRWYFINNLKNKMESSTRNSWKKLLKSILDKDVTGLYHQCLYKNSYLVALSKLPLFFVVLPTLFFSGGEQDIYINYFLLSGVVAFVVTGMKYFLSFGEAERYLHYIIFFMLVKLFSLKFWIVWVIILSLYGALFQLFDFIVAKSKKVSRQHIEVNKMIDWLNDHADKPSCNVATIPYHLLNGWNLLLKTSHNWLSPIYWAAKDRAIFDKFILKYPYIDIRKLPEIINKYKVEYVFISKKALQLQKIELCDLAKDFNYFEFNSAYVFFKK